MHPDSNSFRQPSPRDPAGSNQIPAAQQIGSFPTGGSAAGGPSAGRPAGPTSPPGRQQATGRPPGPPPGPPGPPPLTGRSSRADLPDEVRRAIRQITIWWRSDERPPLLTIALPLAAAAVAGAIVITAGVATVGLLSSGSVMLVTEPRTGAAWYLLADGEEPAFEHRVSLPDSFEPADWPNDDESPPGFAPGGDHLIGSIYEHDDGGVISIGLDDGDVVELLDTAGRPDVSLVGDRILVVDHGSSTDRCYLVRPGDDPVELAAGDSCRFDREGRWVAVTDRDRVSLIEVDDGEVRFTVAGTDVDFAPDGRHVAVSGDDGTSLVSTDSGEEVVSSTTDSSTTFRVWNDGSALALHDSTTSALELLDTEGGIITIEGIVDAQFVDDSGTDLLMETADGALELLSTASGEITPLLDDASLVAVRDAERNEIVGHLVHDDESLGRIEEGQVATVLDLPDDTVEVSVLEQDPERLLVLTQSSEGRASLFRVDGDETSVVLEERALSGTLFPQRDVVTVVLQDADSAFLYVVEGDDVHAIDRADALTPLLWIDGTPHYTRFDGDTELGAESGEATIMKVPDFAERPEPVLDGYLLATGR